MRLSVVISVRCARLNFNGICQLMSLGNLEFALVRIASLLFALVRSFLR